jgi:hypothetical protein
MRRANTRGPPIPSDMAAMAGAKTVPATALTAWVMATRVNDVVHGSTRQLTVTSIAAITIVARLAFTRSINAPAGVCATRAVSPATVMTAPMLAGSHLCTASR